jgi:putative flippase GtrA
VVRGTIARKVRFVATLSYAVRIRSSLEPTQAPRYERTSVRLLRFARALVVGSGATIVDFSVLSMCIRLGGLVPTTARLPALMAGATVQFFGNRTYTFRAQRGSLPKQAKLFLVAELAALAMNWSLFRLLVGRLTFLPPELVSFVGTFLVFIGFAYPMRKLVIFRLPDAPPSSS